MAGYDRSGAPAKAQFVFGSPALAMHLDWTWGQPIFFVGPVRTLFVRFAYQALHAEPATLYEKMNNFLFSFSNRQNNRPRHVLALARSDPAQKFGGIDTPYQQITTLIYFKKYNTPDIKTKKFCSAFALRS
jgi:hypothetical protein